MLGWTALYVAHFQGHNGIWDIIHESFSYFFCDFVGFSLRSGKCFINLVCLHVKLKVFKHHSLLQIFAVIDYLQNPQNGWCSEHLKWHPLTSDDSDGIAGRNLMLTLTCALSQVCRPVRGLWMSLQFCTADASPVRASTRMALMTVPLLMSRSAPPSAAFLQSLSAP